MTERKHRISTIKFMLNNPIDWGIPHRDPILLPSDLEKQKNNPAPKEKVNVDQI